MQFRVTDTRSNSDLASRINSQRSQLSVFQQQLTTGKRINRPSDDPSGAEVVLNLRTSQTEVAQFQRVSQAAAQRLGAADDTLNSYEALLDRVRTLVTQGLSDTTTQAARDAIATEIDGLRARILNLANTSNNGEFLFGGTRQNAPPFDPTTGIPAATPTTAQFVQIEPGAGAIQVSVTADSVFSDATSTIFADLSNAATALRGTGDPAADRLTLEATSARLVIYSNLENAARAVIGANMNSTESAQESLASSNLSLDERASAIEGADFAEAAVGLAAAERALEATLQVAARSRRSLFDFLS